MSKITIQPSTDEFIIPVVRKRVHYLLGCITNQEPDFDYASKIVKYYVKQSAKLKAPVANLGRAELLINDDQQIKKLHELYGQTDFNPLLHMNSDSKDISGHLVFSLNGNLFDDLLDESFNDVDYWGTNTLINAKNEIILIMLLFDALFLVTYYEYGELGLKAVVDGRLANNGQWWAWMELNKFSSASYKHAGVLLNNTKNSSLDASVNGASALFPTNITYARFSGFIRSFHKQLKSYNTLINKFSVSKTNDFNLVITDSSLSIFAHILANFRFHAVAVYSANIHMFHNSYVGYINMWRYNNNKLRKKVR